jgi:hypothetical protein
MQEERRKLRSFARYQRPGRGEHREVSVHNPLFVSMVPAGRRIVEGSKTNGQAEQMRALIEVRKTRNRFRPRKQAEVSVESIHQRVLNLKDSVGGCQAAARSQSPEYINDVDKPTILREKEIM